MGAKIPVLFCISALLIVMACSIPSFTITVGSTQTPVITTATAKQDNPTLPAPTAELVIQMAALESTATIEPSPVPTPVHLVKPVEPVGKYQKIHDQISQKVASEKRAYGGDDYAIGRFERSFTQEMLYLPNIDIQTAELNREDLLWTFVRIGLISDPRSEMGEEPLYGVELDVDLDNRGEYLILAKAPIDNQWTVQGVQVWRDLNKNVGGQKPVKGEDSTDGDGYEKIIFDEGKGQDVDLAWVRISSKGTNFVEIAFKNVITGGEKGKFIWLPWALVGMREASTFEFNDRFTFKAAGSPLIEYAQFYPLKELWGVDNTCRGISGNVIRDSSMIGTCDNYDPAPSRPDAPGPDGPTPIPGWRPPTLY